MVELDGRVVLIHKKGTGLLPWDNCDRMSVWQLAKCDFRYYTVFLYSIFQACLQMLS